MPGITHWQHQKWFGYFPSVVTFESILGDLYSSSVTNPGFNVSSRKAPVLPYDLVCWRALCYSQREALEFEHMLPEPGMTADMQWSCSPACTELEQVVTDWMVEVLGLDPVFRTSGGKGGGIIGVSKTLNGLLASPELGMHGRS